MKCVLSVLTVALCLLPTARAADEENPFKKAKVGDYTEYKMTITTMMGQTFDTKIRKTVVAKDDKEATVETIAKVSNMGKDLDLPAQKQKIDLTKPYDPTSAVNMPKGADVKVEKGSGTEKIMVGGKQYECSVLTAKSNIKLGDMNVETEMKLWMCKSVPLEGMVKMEMKSKIANSTMELIGSGSK